MPRDGIHSDCCYLFRRVFFFAVLGDCVVAMLATVCNNFLVCSAPYWLWAGVSDKRHKAFPDNKFNKLISSPFCLQAWGCIFPGYTYLNPTLQNKTKKKSWVHFYLYPAIITRTWLSCAEKKTKQLSTNFSPFVCLAFWWGLVPLWSTLNFLDTLCGSSRRWPWFYRQ